MKHGLILLIFLSAHVCAQRLTVIYDAGDSLPVAPYLPKPAEANVANDTERGDGERRRPAPSVEAPSVFPIVSPSLTPGLVPTRAFDIPYLQTPIFVVGYDPMSMEWLSQSASQLETLGAIGLVVSVDNDEQLQALRARAGSLQLLLVSGEVFAQFLGITHYPVLVSKRGIEQ